MLQCKMLLDPFVAEELALKGDKENGIEPMIIPNDEQSQYTPYLYIYGRYRKNIDESIYWR